MYPDSNDNGNSISEGLRNFFSELKRAHPLIILSFLFIIICLVLFFINVFFVRDEDQNSSERNEIIEKEDIPSKLQSIKYAPDQINVDFLEGNDIETYYEYYIEFGALFPPGVKLYKIGDEVVTTDYYNYFLLKKFPESLQDPSILDNVLVEAMDDVIKSESVILQTFAKEDPSLTKHVLNEDIITYIHLRERDEAYKEAVNDFVSEHIWEMKGERISVWYHNMFEPKMGKEAAKKLAFEKISALHRKVESGEITMREAGEMIKNDQEIAKIDISYESNAYHYFENPMGYGVYLDPELQEKLEQMEEGELSEILTGNDVNGGYDAFYTFIKVIEIKGDKRHIIDVYNENYMNYPIEYL